MQLHINVFVEGFRWGYLTHLLIKSLEALRVQPQMGYKDRYFSDPFCYFYGSEAFFFVERICYGYLLDYLSSDFKQHRSHIGLADHFWMDYERGSYHHGSAFFEHLY